MVFERYSDTAASGRFTRTRQLATGIVAVGLLLLFTDAFLPCQAHAQLAKGKSKFLGCSIASIPSSFATYWNQVTPENDGKWGSVEGTQGNYTWTTLDNIYNYAVNNGFRYKHHNLVWGQQQPAWISSLDSAGQRAAVEDWIRSVCERYPSMSFVDVVNEPFHAPPSYMNALGGSGATGWDWVVTAFQWARQYCVPGVKLLLNEYNILQDNSVTGNYLRLIDTLKVRGLIDGIGIQGHYFEFKSYAGATPSYSYPVSTLKYNLDRLTATGLPVYISEFDINEADDSIQLQNYQTYFPLFWEDPGVKGITLWGYIQGATWKTNAYLLRSNGTERPSLQWLRHYLASPLPPILVSPVGTTGEPRNAVLVWHPSATALSYHLQVSESPGFLTMAVDTTIADTLARLEPRAANTVCYWRVSAVNDSGSSSYSATGNFTTGDQTVDVKVVPATPLAYALLPNYPNPFNPSTVISGQWTANSKVTLVVYDVLGREVAVLADGRYPAGRYAFTFNANGLASGIYYYRLQAGPFVETRTMVLMK